MWEFLKVTIKKTPDPHYHKTQNNAKPTISNIKIPETNNAVFALSKKLKAIIKKSRGETPYVQFSSLSTHSKDLRCLLRLLFGAAAAAAERSQ
jgi:hypothetical protein